jgi:hypothetical protein
MCVHGSKTRAIDGNHAATDQTKCPADGNEALAGNLNRAGIVMTEDGDGLEVRH